MAVCISILRTERYLPGSWVYHFRSNLDDIRRVLARYKEHVRYWNTPNEVVQKELTEFGIELQRDPHEISLEFDRVPDKRFDIAESVADGFCRNWKNHINWKPNERHQPGLKNETDGSMTLFCQTGGEVLGRSNVLLSEDQGRVHQLFAECIARST